MGLSTKDDLTGESLTGVIRTALRERWQRLTCRRRAPSAKERVHEALRRVDALPSIDDRSEAEILGYDENGLPH